MDEKLNAEIKSREANAVNGDIVTASESDDADEICRIKSPLDDSMKKLILKKRKSITLKATRLEVKCVAEQNFLQRKVSHKVKGIAKNFLILVPLLKNL